ncbi:carbon-nitrogen hydrolase family protein [Vibrio brasiliensis]|uniref:carbon-nitrogen hydrolase family protein n=1 Tax=Vibrio brasiliensis TaxID=170652 RepID=UPI001EFEA3B2|nr:carbon-nitrogen hydrolase family protein [Vibrio brasiliensis]MCG9753099.1 carbon-nitrogen hydrolase family protein [Vibrio brasiliensis]
MESTSFTIVQLKVEHSNKRKNIDEVDKILSATSDVGDITLLPELFATGYIFDSASDIHGLSEDYRDSVTIRGLTELSQIYQTTFVAGIAEKEHGEYYNSVAVVDTSGLRYKYRKISQTSIDKRYFSRGSDLLIFKHNGLKIGVVVCFDIWFPEIMRRLKGVDIILHLANFGGSQSFTLARARALENGQSILTCNRVGEDTTSEFTASYCGGSRVYNPKGEAIVTLGEQQASETVVIDDFSLAPQFTGINFEEELDAISKRLAERFTK